MTAQNGLHWALGPSRTFAQPEPRIGTRRKRRTLLYEEWVQGDPNHTAALVLLGLALLTAGFWAQISSFLAALLAPSWAKFCTVIALGCFGAAAAIYPWLRPVHGHVKERRKGLNEQLQVFTVPAFDLYGRTEVVK